MAPRFTLAQLFELGPEYRGQVSEQLRSSAVTTPRRRKFGNTPTERLGHKFDSKLEARCYEWHKARAAAGEIAWFTRQVPFTLEGGVVYRADFLAVLAPGAAAPSIGPPSSRSQTRKGASPASAATS